MAEETTKAGEPNVNPDPAAGESQLQVPGDAEASQTPAAAAAESTAAGKNAGKGKAPTPPVEKPKRVRVICKGVLGHQRLVAGDVTSHPDYVAILEQPGQKKVVEVK